MSSDAEYASFLDKANQDTGPGNASAQSKTAKSKAVNTEVPEKLQSVEETYTSDADEPFEPVSLKWEGKSIPSAKDLAELIGQDAGNVESISQKDFDAKGQYEKVVEVVKEVGNGKAEFFSVAHGGTRTEYFVLSLDTTQKRLLGMKAMSIES